MAALSYDIILPHLSNIKVPKEGDKIFKDECVYTFDTPESETGLYVCLTDFLGLGKRYVEEHTKATGHCVFLHLRRTKREVVPPQNDEDGSEPKKLCRLALGVEGGFDGGIKKYEYTDENGVVVFPDVVRFPLPDPNLPMQLILSVDSILASDSASRQQELQALSGTWEGESRQNSKYSESLVQLDNGVKIPPLGWKCARCDMRDNLWLNLTDGTVLCGRKFFDGSGGNNHALQYFKETNYPLVVKLGTITPDGADVYSYAEDDMVIDTQLEKHLAHFGINITQMKKTDKSMVELEIDLNQKIGEWSIIQESGTQLKPLYGPGFTGLANMGNSCYLNSVMQVVMSLPVFQKIYYEGAYNIIKAVRGNPAEDFAVQMAKLAYGLLSGEYSKETMTVNRDGEAIPEEQPGIKPQMFKNLISKNHPEFSTKRQQDAQEFFLHFVNTVDRNCRNQENPADCFKFEVEERIRCTVSRKVRYTKKVDCLLPLVIPLEAATNKEEVEAYEIHRAELEERGEKLEPDQVVRPIIPLLACINAFAHPELVDDFYSTAVKKKVTAEKTTRLLTFPDYLMIQMKKFTLGQDWVPKKLDVKIEVPDELNLSILRSNSDKACEELLPADDVTVELDEAVISQLQDMGFPAGACRRAVYKTNNAGVEAASQWIMEHMDDPDFGEPFVAPGSVTSSATNSASAGTPAPFTPIPEALQMIASMGFTEAQATQALKATDNNVERAVDWIFSHADELSGGASSGGSPMEVGENVAASASEHGPQLTDGEPNYRLLAFISHMGSSTMVGHYVCHIRKDNGWVIFNDNKVAQSERPPKEFGYLYLYERVK